MFEKAAAETTATRPEYWEEKHIEIGEGANEKKTVMAAFLYLNSAMIRNPRQSRSLDSTPWIPDPCTGVQTLSPWNLDFVFYL